MNLKSVKVQLFIFLGALGTYISFLEKDTIFLKGLCIALASAALSDSIISYLKTKKLIIPESSLVSGLIIGFALSGGQAWWKIALASLIAISSKHIIQFKKRHIFNPASFGIVLTVFIFGAITEWKGAYLWHVIVPAGIYFYYKIRRIELVFSYFITSLVLFGGQAIIQNIPLSSIIGYFNYFFIFIMLIEPKTSPALPKAKIIFGIGAAVAIFILNNIGIRESELLGLLFLNFTFRALQKV